MLPKNIRNASLLQEQLVALAITEEQLPFMARPPLAQQTHTGAGRIRGAGPWLAGHTRRALPCPAHPGRGPGAKPSPPRRATLALPRPAPPWCASPARSGRRPRPRRTGAGGPGSAGTAAAPAVGPASPAWCWSGTSARWGDLQQSKGGSRVNLAVRTNSSAAIQETAEQTRQTRFMRGDEKLVQNHLRMFWIYSSA